MRGIPAPPHAETTLYTKRIALANSEATAKSWCYDGSARDELGGAAEEPACLIKRFFRTESGNIHLSYLHS
jgi:hypothetical protein